MAKSVVLIIVTNHYTNSNTLFANVKTKQMIAISFVMCYICACHTHSNSKCVNLKWCGQLLCLLPATAREVWRCHLNLDMLRLTFFWPKHNILLIATAQLNWLPKHHLIRTDESSGRHRRGSFTKHQACKFQHMEFLLPVHIPNPCVCGPQVAFC